MNEKTQETLIRLQALAEQLVESQKREEHLHEQLREVLAEAKSLSELERLQQEISMTNASSLSTLGTQVNLLMQAVVYISGELIDAGILKEAPTVLPDDDPPS